TGASNDIQRATAIAKDMITKYGFSEILGPILYGGESREVFLGRDFSNQAQWSEETTAVIDKEIKALVDAAYKQALHLLTEHRDQLDAVAAYLLEHDKMTGEQFENVMKGLPADGEPTVEETPAEQPAEETAVETPVTEEAPAEQPSAQQTDPAAEDETE
ncbi:MAG: ATP-dependent zinc metalloprotease FtsH, partial [Clostridia bacterium]|nr:ATP-dependent zinc metalloprotease FtsH [Clostridia bacterium]